MPRRRPLLLLLLHGRRRAAREAGVLLEGSCAHRRRLRVAGRHPTPACSHGHSTQPSASAHRSRSKRAIPYSKPCTLFPRHTASPALATSRCTRRSQSERALRCRWTASTKAPSLCHHQLLESSGCRHQATGTRRWHHRHARRVHMEAAAHLAPDWAAEGRPAGRPAAAAAAAAVAAAAVAASPADRAPLHSTRA